MGKDHTQFVVGQKAEARSFMRGFRSSWFRCEIKEIKQIKQIDNRRSEQISALVDYYDYTEQRPLWLVLYQEPPYGRKSDRRKNLMLRPEYPVICHESQVTDVNTAQEVVLVVNGPWKVGDMVDWLGEGCYWSGRLTEILGTDKVQIELIPPPTGEGGCYAVSVKDLRPSLEWSIESGWTVPISKDREDSCCCARLFYPMRQGNVLNNVVHTGDDSTKRPPDEGRCSDGCIEEASAGKRTFEEFSGSYQGTTSSEGIVTLEDAVLGLEEISNKVKWLKRILNSGVPLSKSGGPSWKFLEHHG